MGAGEKTSETIGGLVPGVASLGLGLGGALVLRWAAKAELDAARKLQVHGTAQAPTLEWAANPGGPRTIEEAVDIARANGVHIPDDIIIYEADGMISDPKILAMYYNNSRARLEDVVRWTDFYNPNGKISIFLRQEILSSDEAIVAVLAHEMHELNALRSIFNSTNGQLSARMLRDLIHPGISRNLHDEAWDVADAAVRQMRGEIK